MENERVKKKESKSQKRLTTGQNSHYFIPRPARDRFFPHWEYSRAVNKCAKAGGDKNAKDHPFMLMHLHLERHLAQLIALDIECAIRYWG